MNMSQEIAAPDAGATPPPVILAFARARPAAPEPLSTRVTYSDTVAGVDSHISRTWAEGATARCRLCPYCTAVANHCQVRVNRYVDEAEARMFSVVAFLARA
jgi:hypothetical protein